MSCSVFNRNEEDGFLKCSIEGRELVIRVGIDRLCSCLEQDDGPMHGYKVKDQKGFILDMIREMYREDEVGNTPVSSWLDSVAITATEDGSLHVELPDNK